MNKLLFFIFITGFTSNAYGQSEFTTKFKAIPPLNTKVKPKKETLPPPPLDLFKIVAPNVLKETNIFGTKPKLDTSFQMGSANNFSLTPNNKFVNPGDKVANRLNKKANNEDQIIYRRNQNLGDFKTKSLMVKIIYRDYGEVDGDIIRVLLNDKVIATGITLDSEFQGFDIALVTGFNKLDFEALNQGALGPNTAEFQVYDDKENLISASQWNLGTGFKATIIITKE